jgi:hypothetical protein
MFIDRLLDNWGRNKQRSIESGILDIFAGNYDPDKFKKDLRSAIPFNLDNVSEYLLQKYGELDTGRELADTFHIKPGVPLVDAIDKTTFPNVKSVYPYSWFEYSGKYVGAVRIGVFVWSFDNPDNLLNQNNIAVYFVESNEFMDIASRSLSWSNDLTGNLNFTSIFPDLKPGRVNDTVALLKVIIPVWVGLSFLHCKNVTIQSTEPPVKLQKARERRGKLPLFTFKTLEIKPMTKILREEGQSETLGLARALHICRGHFKDYSKGPGLGRNHSKGLYWWDSQVRGNRDIGAVIKDYKVSPCTVKELK